MPVSDTEYAGGDDGRTLIGACAVALGSLAIMGGTCLFAAAHWMRVSTIRAQRVFEFVRDGEYCLITRAENVGLNRIVSVIGWAGWSAYAMGTIDVVGAFPILDVFSL